ncbi:MAG: single-stranded DNA-binding protein [Verrucomicrobiota bacterium]
MASLNKVMIIGNLTRDPELRYTPKGQAVVDLALAMNRRYVVDGEKREEVTYVDVTFWGKGAEIISQYMKKGNPMYIEGRLRLDQWDDKESGKKQSRLKITGEEFQFLGGKGESGGGGQGGGGQHYDEEGGSSRSSGGGYSQSRPPQQQQRPPQSSGGYSQSGGSGGGNASPQGQSRPDAFPPGLDDDEIPF